MRCWKRWQRAGPVSQRHEHGRENLTNEALKALAASGPSLARIHMSQCGKSIEEALKAVAANCLSMVSLNRSECCKPAHEALKAVTAGCSCLNS